MRFRLAVGPKHRTIPCQQITAGTLAIFLAVIAASHVAAVVPPYHRMKDYIHALGSELVGSKGLT